MTARLTEVERDGLVLDVLDEGPIDGDPVVLLHGFPERLTSWRHVTPLLHEAGLRTIAVDQRGFSPKARPKGRRAYAAQHFAADALAVIDAVGGRAHLVGHDWGSATAWAAAVMAPEKVASLTAISVPHPGAFMRSMIGTRQILKSWYMAMFNVPRVPEMLAKRRGGYFDARLRAFGMTPDDIERFHTEIEEYGALPGGLGWYRALPFAERGLLGRTVRVPTTLLWSDGDVAIDRASVDATADWVEADYELVVLPGVSHWIPVHAPHETATAVLRRIERSR